MPTFTIRDYETMVHEAEGIDVDEVIDHEAYRFSSKTFYEDDTAGVYGDEPEE